MCACVFVCIRVCMFVVLTDTRMCVCVTVSVVCKHVQQLNCFHMAYLAASNPMAHGTLAKVGRCIVQFMFGDSAYTQTHTDPVCVCGGGWVGA